MNLEALPLIATHSAQLKGLQAQKEYLIASNTKMAQHNLNRQPSFDEMRDYLMNLNQESLSLNKQVAAKLDKIRKFYDHYSLESILALMQTSLQEAEEESEQVANRFLDKAIGLDVFLKEYIDRRTQAHLSRVKTEHFTVFCCERGQI